MSKIIKDLIIFYVTENYNNYLTENKLENIKEEKIKEIVSKIYFEKKKTF